MEVKREITETTFSLIAKDSKVGPMALTNRIKAFFQKGRSSIEGSLMYPNLLKKTYT
jgi:hypothetical protein